MWQFLGNAALNSLPSGEGRPCAGVLGVGGGVREWEQGRDSGGMGYAQVCCDFCWRGYLSLFRSALPHMEGMEAVLRWVGGAK